MTGRRVRGGLAATLFLAMALLAGCATRPPPQSLATAVSGRLAVRVDAPEPGASPRSSNAVFELLGEPAAGELRLSSPLGTLLAVARWRPGSAWLQAEGQVRQFSDLDELTREMIGEPLPVAALFDWLRARPWAGAPSEPLPAGATGFSQLGWRVELAQAGEGLIVATRQTPPVVTVRAKVDPS